MKIAIIGAGISGLACAFEFKKHGITPTVFEKKRRLGEDADFIVSTFKLFDTTYKDPLKYLKDKYSIELKPLNILKEIVMNSPNRKTIVKGTRGYIFCKGELKQSIENQLVLIADTPIIFNKNINIDDIKEEYDYVIDATSMLDMPNKLGIAASYMKSFSRIAVINGSFNENSVSVWFNTEYSKNCFCFLLPYSMEKASLILTVNDISQQELDYYWEKFLTKENMTNMIIKTSDVKHELGAVYPHKVDNIYFVGNAGATCESFFGTGVINSIETGILAARSIVEKLDYDIEARRIFEHSKKMYEFRKVLNIFDNKAFDKFVTVSGMPVIKQLVYKNPLAKVTQGAIFAKAYNKLWSATIKAQSQNTLK